MVAIMAKPNAQKERQSEATAKDRIAHAANLLPLLVRDDLQTGQSRADNCERESPDGSAGSAADATKL